MSENRNGTNDSRRPLKMSIAIVKSGFYNAEIQLPVFCSSSGNIILSHIGLKSFVLNAMKAQIAQCKTPIHYEYKCIDSSMEHPIVDCTFSIGPYIVTESGESSTYTAYTNVARNYPYLEAQKRAFDRAAISFFQLQVDGKQVFADSELNQ